MKRKLLMVLPVFALLVTSVMALSLRGDGGTVNQIGSDSNLIPSKIHFSANSNGNSGQGSLQVIAKTSEGKRVVLGVSFNSSGSGRASYWKQGSGLQRLPVLVTYNYNTITGKTTITGTGSLNFLITNIPTIEIK